MDVPQQPNVNFTGGLRASNNGPSSSTDITLATTLDGHILTGQGAITAAAGANHFDFSASTGTFSTSSGAVSLNGPVTAGGGTTVGTAVNVATGNGLSTGTALNVSTGTSAFSGNAVNIASDGVFTGTLVKLAANTTTAGTILGISATSLQTGAVIDANLGSAIYTGTAGALRLTANAASSGTLLAVSGTSLGANGGIAANIAVGVPTGVESASGKALRVALGTQGDALYANAATGYTGKFLDLAVDGTSVLSLSATDLTTTTNISQSGNTTFSTGMGPVSLNGNTTIAAGKSVTAAAGAGNFDFGASTGTFSTGTGAVTLKGSTTLASGESFTAAGGVSAFNFGASSGAFDTSTGAVTLRGNTATASGVTLTAGLGISSGDAVTVATGTTTGRAINVTTGAGVTTGSAVNVDIGASAPGAVASTNGLALNLTGSGAFAGTGNNATFARIASTGAFTGTLTKLVADNTQTGTVLGISAASLTTGKAIDVRLAAAYAGGGANNGAVNVAAGAFSGNILSVSASSDAQTATASLANFAAPLTQGHVLNVGVTGAYVGTGAIYLDLTGATGVPTGSGFVVNAASAYTGRFIDLQLAGASKFAVDPVNGVTTSLNVSQTGATTTFSTGQGSVSLNGATTLASGKSLTAAGGASNLDFSLSTGTFKTGTGAVSLNGNTTLASGSSLKLGGASGTGITAHYSVTASLDFPNTGNGACNNLTVAVTGAAAGDTVVATPTPVTGGAETLIVNWNAWASAADTVTVRVCSNANAQNPAAQTWRVDVWKH